MGQTLSHMTGKPVTNAIKPADVQLQAFSTAEAEFPRHGCTTSTPRSQRRSFIGASSRIKRLH